MKPIDQIDRSTLLRSPGGDLYEVVGFITDPAVILHRVRDGHREVIIQRAPIAAEWTEVDAITAQGELLDFLRAHHRERMP